MKKTGYKAAAVLLCFFMVLSLSACRGKKDASETAGESSQAAAADTAAADAGSTAAAQEEPKDREPAVVTIYSTNDIRRCRHGLYSSSDQ